MARELKPCGTLAAARRHRRAGEPLCEACADAERDSKRDQRQQDRQEAAEAVSAVVVDMEAGRIADAEANLRTVIAVMDSGQAIAQTAQLSKRRQELQDYIAELRAEEGRATSVSALDELTRMRSLRSARRAEQGTTAQGG